MYFESKSLSITFDEENEKTICPSCNQPKEFFLVIPHTGEEVCEQCYNEHPDIPPNPEDVDEW